jgi:hypothetical protein
MTSVEQFEDSAEHEACEGEVVEGGEGLREAFVVSSQAAESCSDNQPDPYSPSKLCCTITTTQSPTSYTSELKLLTGSRCKGNFIAESPLLYLPMTALW